MDSVAHAHLLIVDATGNRRTRALDRDVITFGSGADGHAHVLIADPELASIHASIQREGATHLLIRHAQPLSVNGLKPRTHVLKDGDLVVMGRTALWFRRGEAPTLSADASAGASPSATSLSVESLVALCRRLVTLASVSSAADGAAPPSRQVADQLLADAMALTGTTSGTLLSFAGEGDPIGFASVSRGDLSPEEALFSETILRRLRDGEAATFVGDTRADPDLATSASVVGAAGRTVFAAPIRRGARLVGALYLSRRAEHGIVAEAGILEVVELYATLGVGLIGEARERSSLEHRLAQLGEPSSVGSTSILGSSAQTRTLVADVRKVAGATRVPVLLLGETGTGKEVVAREIHRMSPRAAGPFVAVHCGAIPSELLASELFGHKKGAFTQAVRDRPGFFRAAEGGTIFLDEIGEMPLAQQVALLRVLQEGHVTPVGDERSIAVDVRIVCATNRSLDHAIAEKAFRADLYFRIAGVTLMLPPLRERAGDAIELASFFLSRERKSASRLDLTFSDGALMAIRSARWEGNVRELEAAIRRAVVMVEGCVIREADLGLAAAVDESFVRPLSLARDEFLKAYVREVVARYEGNRTAAADALLVTPRTVFRYLEEL